MNSTTRRCGKLLVVVGLVVIITVKTHADYQSVVLGDNPLAYYALNPGLNNTGSPGQPYTEPDLTANGNGGAAVNMLPANGPSAFITNAAAFDGADSTTDLSAASSLLNFAGPITLEAWVQNSSSTSFGDILGKGYDSTQNSDEITLRVNGPFGSDYFGNSGSVGVTGGIQTTNWAYVVVSSDGTNIGLYQNGILVQRTRDAFGSISFNDPYRIGTGSANGTSRYFQGKITEVAIYNYGLTGMQVLNHYNAGMFGTTNVATSSKPLKWSDTSNNGVWNTGSSTNWINETNNQHTLFNNGDQALFDDTPGTSTNVTMSGIVSCGELTINSSANNYTLTGPGTISVSGSFLKEGSSTLNLEAPAVFFGPTTISGGTLMAGNYALANAASIIITNNSTMDFVGSTMANNTPMIVSGTGVGGKGAIFNSSIELFGQVLEITLAGDTTFGAASGNNRWDLGNGSSLTGAHKVTINFPNGGYGEWDTVAIDPSVGDLELAVGSWGIKGLGASLGDPAKTLTADVGTSLTVWNSNFGPNSGYNKNIHILANAAFAVRTSPNTFFNANVMLESGSQWDYFNGGGNGQTMNGTYVLNGIVHMLTGDSLTTFANVISGPGGFVWDAYNNSVLFTATNTYTGPTVIGGGLTLQLGGNGSIANSSLIFFGGGNTANVSLDVSGRSDQTFTLSSGQTLGGIGTINGNLSVLSGAMIAPAGTNVILGMTEGNSSTGTLSATGSVTLNGRTVIKLNGSGPSDVVQAGAAITYGGTLILVNIGTPLVVGNSFQIFNAGSFSTNSFASITPPSPGTGLAWDTSHLNSGSLGIIAPPVISNFAVSGGKFIFSGTGGTTNGHYVVLVSSNVTTPVSEWTPIATNSFGADGSFHATNTIGAGINQIFYRIAQLQ